MYIHTYIAIAEFSRGSVGCRHCILPVTDLNREQLYLCAGEEADSGSLLWQHSNWWFGFFFSFFSLKYILV